MNRRKFIKAASGIFVPAMFGILVPKSFAQQAKKQSIGSLDRRVVAAGGGGGAAFSDDFDRADSDSLGENWTEQAGDSDIISNEFVLASGSFANIVATHNTSCNTVNQYVKFTTGSTDFQYPYVVFRFTNSSTEYYAIQIDANTGECEWYNYPDTGTGGSQIGAAVDTGAGINDGTEFGITITGTGANTDIRIWRGTPTLSGLPSAADNWGGDTTPDATWLATDPGASAVDTGSKVGLGGAQGTANSCRFNNFFGGDIP